MKFNDSEFQDLLKDLVRRDKRHKTYDATVKHAQEMSVHIYGDEPTDLMATARPREAPEITKYRQDSFQPITKATANKGIAIVNKIFNPLVSSVVFKEADTKTENFKPYMTEYFMDYNSVTTFLREVLTKKMLADPNGIACVRPKKTTTKESERIEPIVKVFGSSAVVFQDEDHYLILTEIEDDKFFYFEYYDDMEWKRFVAWWSRSKFNVKELDYYSHEFGKVPVWKLRGISEATDTGEVVFKSYFEPARPYWNLAIIHEDDVKGAFVSHMHPIRIEVAEKCDFVWKDQACRSGKIIMPDGSTDVCPGCNGTGRKKMNNPYAVYTVNADKLKGENAIDPVKFVNVPTEATELLEKRAEKMQEKGLWSLNMDVSDDVGENQSGIAKVIDRSELFDFLLAVSETVFDIHMNNIFYFCALYMYLEELGSEEAVKEILPDINKPSSFDLISISEMISNFKGAKESGLDRNYLLIKQIEILNKEFTANPQLKDMMNAMFLIDPLFGYTPDEVDLMVSKRLATRTDAIIHFYIRPFVEEAFKQDPGFMKLPRDKQMEILTKMAEEKESDMDVSLEDDDKDSIPDDESGRAGAGA